jgi:hypothetical protein
MSTTLVTGPAPDLLTLEFLLRHLDRDAFFDESGA